MGKCRLIINNTYGHLLEYVRQVSWKVTLAGVTSLKVQLLYREITTNYEFKYSSKSMKFNPYVFMRLPIFVKYKIYHSQYTGFINNGVPNH